VRVLTDVAKTDGNWSLKVTRPATGDDVLVLQPDTPRTGLCEYSFERDLLPAGDLALRIYAVGQGKSVWIRSLKVECVPGIAGSVASSVQSAWYPSRLSFQAHYDTPALTITGTDFFAGPNTLVRILDASKPAGDASLGLAGGLPGDTPVWNALAHTMSGAGGEITVAVRVVRLDGAGLAIHEMAQIPQAVPGGWRVEIPAPAEVGAHVAVIYGFSTKASGEAEAVRQARSHGDGSSLREALAKCRSKWDDWLGLVPAPEKWGIRDVDAMGVTPEDNRRSYYGAWSFVISNVLPAMPENKYP
jgi:hypothetical protein